MKTVTTLAEHLSTAMTFREKYPMFNEQDGKIHVLFLSPCLNESGYYRMILPALELNKTDTHCAIMAHIHKWDFKKLFDDYDNPVSLQLVKWADYVVLPTMFSDAEYIIRAMRAVNADIDFVMDLDISYHAMPDYHPQLKSLSGDAKDTLLNNLALVDLVTAPNNAILEHYKALAKGSPKEFKFYSEHYANLVSNFTYDDVPEFYRNTNCRVRIGMLLDGFIAEDLRTIENVLIKIMSEHRDTVELVIYGWNRKLLVRHQLLTEIPVTHQAIENTNNFPACLNAMTIDIGLIPFANNFYNRSGLVFNRLLDFSGFMIPSVMPAVTPFNKIIKDGENGFLASTHDEWHSKITKLISDAELRRNIGQAAFQLVWETFSYTNPKAVERLTKVFA